MFNFLLKMSDQTEVCRYCHEKVDVNSKYVHRPCDCRTYVHDDCLRKWLVKRNGANDNESRIVTNGFQPSSLYDLRHDSISVSVGKGDPMSVSVGKGGVQERPLEQIKCEICDSDIVMHVDSKRRCECTGCIRDMKIIGNGFLRFLHVMYEIIGLLLYPFANTFVIFAYTLVDGMNIGAIVGIIGSGLACGIIMPGVCQIIYMYNDYNDEVRIYPILAHIGYIYCASFVVIQLQSCVIANPILGRPIAFTPRGETFGVMFAITLGVALLCLMVFGIVKYVMKTCIASTPVISFDNKEPN